MAARRRRAKLDGLPTIVVLAAIAVLLRGCAVRSTPIPAPVPPVEPHGPSTTDSLAGNRQVALGIPTDDDPSDDVLLDEGVYVVSYNPRRNEPNWAAWQLDASYLGRVRRHDAFRPDPRLPPSVYHVTSRDYLNSGFDRGHLCPSADRTSDPASNSLTFLMTNIEPQLHELNAGPWEKLEQYERELAERPGVELYVVAGGIFDAEPPSIGHHVAVPRANFKIIAVLRAGQMAKDVTGDTQVVAVVLPNEPGVGRRAWTDGETSVDAIERATGYDFFRNVDPRVQAVLESRVGDAR